MPGSAVAQHDAQRGAPLRNTEPERRLTQRLRHELEQLFGGARHHRQHQDGEGNSARDRRKMLGGDDHQRIHEQAHGDRRHAGHHIAEKRTACANFEWPNSAK